MKWIKLACVGGCLAWLAAAASAQNPVLGPPIPHYGPSCQPPIYGGPGWNPSYPAVPTPTAPYTTPPTMPPADKTTPGTTTPNPAQPGANQNNAQDQNQNQNQNQDQNQNQNNNDAFAQGSEAGTQGAGSVAPTMFGDLIGMSSNRLFLVPRGATPPGQVYRGNIPAIIAPQPLHASYKIAENESPNPQDRAFISYTLYENVDRLFSTAHANLDRETIGFEKTFSNGDSSFGMRLPFIQLTGDDRVQDNEVGDLSLIFKQAIIKDCQTGDVLSGGMVVTLPTGQSLHIPGESTLNDATFQPFVGFIYHMDENSFLEGFSSVAVPTDFRDVTLLFNSIGAGYYIYRDTDCTGRQTSIAPQLELHLNTPLSHRGVTSTPVNFSDSLDLTGGVRALFGHTEFGTAIGTPLTGPKPYDYEANATLTFHW